MQRKLLKKTYGRCNCIIVGIWTFTEIWIHVFCMSTEFRKLINRKFPGCFPSISIFLRLELFYAMLMETVSAGQGFETLHGPFFYAFWLTNSVEKVCKPPSLHHHNLYWLITSKCVPMYVPFHISPKIKLVFINNTNLSETMSYIEKLIP